MKGASEDKARSPARQGSASRASLGGRSSARAGTPHSAGKGKCGVATPSNSAARAAGEARSPAVLPASSSNAAASKQGVPPSPQKDSLPAQIRSDAKESEVPSKEEGALPAAQSSFVAKEATHGPMERVALPPPVGPVEEQSTLRALRAEPEPVAEESAHSALEAGVDPAEKEDILPKRGTSPHHPEKTALPPAPVAGTDLVEKEDILPARETGLDRAEKEDRLSAPSFAPPVETAPEEDREDAISFKRKSGSDQKLHLRLPSAQAKAIIPEERSELSVQEPPSTGKKSPALHRPQAENVFYAGSTPKEPPAKVDPPGPLAEGRSAQKVNTGGSSRKTL